MKILTLNDAIWVIRNTMAEGSLRDTIELRLEEKATEPSGDLISREAVRDLHNRIINTKDCGDSYINFNGTHYQLDVGYAFEGMDMFLKEIDKLPTIQPKKGEWIPVTERLPKPYEQVLRTVKSVGWNSTFHIHVDIGIICQIDTDVIAWQPLPTPYKVDKESKE